MIKIWHDDAWEDYLYWQKIEEEYKKELEENKKELEKNYQKVLREKQQLEDDIQKLENDNREKNLLIAQLQAQLEQKK